MESTEIEVDLVEQLHELRVTAPNERVAIIVGGAANEIVRLRLQLAETAERPYCSRCGYPCMRCNGGR